MDYNCVKKMHNNKNTFRAQHFNTNLTLHFTCKVKTF